MKEEKPPLLSQLELDRLRQAAATKRAVAIDAYIEAGWGPTQAREAAIEKYPIKAHAMREMRTGDGHVVRFHPSAQQFQYKDTYGNWLPSVHNGNRMVRVDLEDIEIRRCADLMERPVEFVDE